jgi:hypothetical protein
MLEREGNTMLAIISIDGCYWTGETWSREPSEAKPYPPGSGYETCNAEAARLRAERGVICFPASIQTAQEP